MQARLEGVRRRLIREHDDRAWLAWHVAMLSRQTKLPPLHKLLSRHETRRQTPEEMFQAVLGWHLAAGGAPLPKLGVS